MIAAMRPPKPCSYACGTGCRSSPRDAIQHFAQRERHTLDRSSPTHQPTILTTLMKVSAIMMFTLAVLLMAAAAEEQNSTPAPTTTAPYYDGNLACWAISVEHDATYCIDGPICSGSGLEPAGLLCPVKGDVAIADCHAYLESYGGAGSCALPVDATCQVIKTGAWGCVLSGSATPAPTTTCDGNCKEEATPAPTKTCGGECENITTPYPTSTKVPNPTATVTSCPTGTEAPTLTPPHTPTPTQCAGNCSDSGSGSFEGNNTIKAETTFESSTSSGVSAGVVGAIAAVAAVVAVIAGAAIYKQYTKKLDEDEDCRVDVVTP